MVNSLLVRSHHHALDLSLGPGSDPEPDLVLVLACIHTDYHPDSHDPDPCHDREVPQVVSGAEEEHIADASENRYRSGSTEEHSLVDS